MLISVIALAVAFSTPLRSRSLVMSSEPAESSAARFGQLSRLENELASAIGDEDYAAAAMLRDQLQGLRADEDIAVLAANSLFYRAFSTNDLELMGECWRADGGAISCAHPGFAPIHGHEAVMSSWQQIFGGMKAEVVPSDVRLVLLSGRQSAMVTCLEIVDKSSKLVATNVFEKTDDGWRMVLHQAGPLMASGDEDD